MADEACAADIVRKDIRKQRIRCGIVGAACGQGGGDSKKTSACPPSQPGEIDDAVGRGGIVDRLFGMFGSGKGKKADRGKEMQRAPSVLAEKCPMPRKRELSLEEGNGETATRMLALLASGERSRSERAGVGAGYFEPALAVQGLPESADGAGLHRADPAKEAQVAVAALQASAQGEGCSGMNADTAYTVNLIQKGLPLLTFRPCETGGCPCFSATARRRKMV